MNRRRALIGLFVVAVIAVVGVATFTLVADQQWNRHGGVRFGADLDAAQDRAAAADRPLVVYFWGERCGACEEFDERIADTPALRSALESFERASVSTDEAGGREAMDRYGVSLTPTLVVTTPAGEPVEVLYPANTSALTETLRAAEQEARPR